MRGYAANIVVSQSPAPGTRVIATARRSSSLRLEPKRLYAQTGEPEDARPTGRQPPPALGSARTATPTATKRPGDSRATPAATKAAPRRRMRSRAAKTAAAKPAATAPPAFEVAGRPKEPLDEMSLSDRAKQLAAWVERIRTDRRERRPLALPAQLDRHRREASAGGDGADALRTLVAVDNRVQKLWGVGAQSEQVARQTLAKVKERSVEAALGATRSEESGYNLIELLTAMAILGVVMTSLTTVLVSATNADVRMNQNFQAQTQARTALDRFRREGHAACRADPAGADDVDHADLHHLRQLPRLGRAAGELVHGCGRASRYGLFRATGADVRRERRQGRRLPDGRKHIQLPDDLVSSGARSRSLSRSTRTRTRRRGTYTLDDNVGSPQRDQVGMMRRLRLSDERGIALVITLGILLVTSVHAGDGDRVLVDAGRGAHRSKADQTAYALAEAGINNAMAVLANPTNNALNSTLLPARTPPTKGAA